MRGDQRGWGEVRFDSVWGEGSGVFVGEGAWRRLRDDLQSCCYCLCEENQVYWEEEGERSRTPSPASQSLGRLNVPLGLSFDLPVEERGGHGGSVSERVSQGVVGRSPRYGEVGGWVGGVEVCWGQGEGSHSQRCCPDEWAWFRLLSIQLPQLRK